MLIFAPVFQGRDRHVLSGYLYVVLFLPTVFEQIIAKLPPRSLDIYFYDPDTSPDKRFIHWHSSLTRATPAPFIGEAALRAGPHVALTLTVAGRKLGALYVPTEQLLAQGTPWPSMAILLAGLTITALLMLLLAAWAHRTATLQTLNRRFNDALDNMPHGLSMFDRGQRLIVCNRQYAEIYGIPSEQAKPGTPFRTILEKRSAKHSDDPEANIARGIEHASQRQRSTVEFGLLDGRAISIALQPTADGGWVAVHQDVTERKRIEKSLAAASQAKSQFLATMSHEIRTPIHAVLGLTSALLDTRLDAEQHKMLDTVYEAGSGLLEILNDVLDFSKLESGDVMFESIAFSSRQLVDGVVRMFEPRAAAKGVTVRLEYDERLPPTLCGDLGRVRQILLNLLSNAVKFTARGEVTLTARCLALSETAATIEWQVADTGIGIDPDRISDLFKDFTQADASINRRFGGSGLGLAICKRLVERMGGKIGAVSTPGEGSTFSFDLTLPIAHTDVTDKTMVSSDALTDAIAKLGRPLRILSVDDKPVNRMVVAKMLKEFDIRLEEACDGQQAVEAVSVGDYDVILMDVRMPRMDGLEATRAVRARGGKHARVPIIAFTANAFPEDVKTCFDAGMTDFLTKPVQKQDLIGAIARTLQTDGQSATAMDAAIARAAADRPPSFDSAPLVDHEVLDAFTAAVGSDAAAEVLGMFVKDAGARLQMLQQLSCAGDRERIKTEAHALKGEAATLGLIALSLLAKTLEHSALDIAPEQYADLVARIRTTFELSRPELPIPLAA